MMFENEIAINKFLVGYLNRIVEDIPAESMTTRAHPNGHPPMWVLGHLAWSADFGGTFCGEVMKREGWTAIFGLGSSDELENPSQYDRNEMLECIKSGFEHLQGLAASQSREAMAEPHGVPGLDRLQSKGQMVCHLLTSHLSFHISQLSTWRRANGNSFLF